VSTTPDANLVTAIEQAYRDGFPRFLRLAVAMLGDLDRGRDAVQEAFARALRSRGDLRQLDRLDGWLWHTLVNVCRVEKRRPIDALQAVREADPKGLPDDWSELRALIAALPERQRLVLFLRHYADLDYEQIAGIARVRRGTVAATLHAAHARIRAEMIEVLR
jgi:RNA polymerase sigma factor (sigma-70 family)